MEGGSTGGVGSSGGGPAPFLLKTYDMIDDSSTDNIVSWSSNKNSFVVWNPPEFARQLLPTYFKHNNFSSFIRQLNTYGFRKIDPEKWEFANEDFIKDQKQLLKNIHRRKPIHSHSQPQGSTGDGERAALDEEIERLGHEKTSLQANIWRFKQQQSGTKHQLGGLEIRVQEMEQRQQRMMAFIAKAVQNPTFVEHLIRMTGSSMDISAITKKRRLPGVDFCQDVAENSFVDNYSCTSKPDFGHIFHQDFSNKLKLELSPAVSDSNLVSLSAQSSNENGENVLRRVSEGDPKDVLMRTEGLSFAPETLELSDTGTSFSLRKDTPLLRRAKSSESSRLHCLPHSWISDEEGDGHISCHLNLTLASTPLQVSDSHYSSRIPQLDQEVGTLVGLKLSNSSKEADTGVLVKNKNYVDADVTPSTVQNVAVINQGHGAGQGRVNDLFWEQFLTERPGSSDTEEASSTFRGNVHDEQEERKTAQVSWRKDMEQLTL